MEPVELVLLVEAAEMEQQELVLEPEG